MNQETILMSALQTLHVIVKLTKKIKMWYTVDFASAVESISHTMQIKIRLSYDVTRHGIVSGLSRASMVKRNSQLP